MANYLLIDIYIDKNKNLILVPYKECKAGFAIASEPYWKFDSVEWDNVSVHLLKLFDECIKQPTTEEMKSTVFQKICGNKGFKHFSRKHICIELYYEMCKGMFEIANKPRLSDGSYGTEKGSLSEKYSISYTCIKDAALIQENIQKAYKDAEEYLEKLGAKL